MSHILDHPSMVSCNYCGIFILFYEIVISQKDDCLKHNRLTESYEIQDRRSETFQNMFNKDVHNLYSTEKKTQSGFNIRTLWVNSKQK